jgi:cell division protein FtsB
MLNQVKIRKTQEPKKRPPSKESNSSVLSNTDWRRIRTELRAIVGEIFSHQVKKLTNTIEQLNAENNLLKAENEGLRQTIFIEKQRRKRGKPLFNTLCQDNDCRAVFYNPSKIQQARDELALREQKKQQANTKKANDKIQMQLAKEKKEEKLKQRRVNREHARVQRKKDTKAKAAKKEEDKLQRQAVQ